MSLDPVMTQADLPEDNRERTKRLPAADDQHEDLKRKQQRRNSNRMKITNRKLYAANGLPFDPHNDLLDEYDGEEDDEDEDDDEEDEDDVLLDEDEEEEDDSQVLTRRFELGVLQKKLFNKDVNNNPSSPTDSRFPKPPSPKRLDDNSRESVPLPGPPRDLVAQIVRPRFVTLSWMEPNRHPDEVVSYDVFYKMTTSDR